MSVNIPVVAVVFGSVSPPQGDVIECTVHLGCSKEVSSYTLKLQNWNGKYSPNGPSPITVGLDGSISVGRGANCPQLITCRVESADFESSPTESYLTVAGRCWGERLFRRVVTKTYSGQKGEAIVKDLMDYYAGLSHARSSMELVEDTDTTFTQLDYTDSPLWDILKYVAESSDKQGVIGFDFRVAPDGKFEFFPKNSKPTAVSLMERIEVGRYRKDISRIRNKITLYGEADKSFPANKPGWAQTLTPADGAWSATSGQISVDDVFKFGDATASIKLYAQNLEYGAALLSLNDGKEADCELYPTFAATLCLESAFDGTVYVDLFDSSLRTAWKKLSVSPGYGDWRTVEALVGPANAACWDNVEAGFDWTHVKKVQVNCFFAGSGTGSFWVGQMYFGGCRYGSVEEDAASQAAYGLREYSETDEELCSDNECSLRAKALLNYLKAPAQYLTVTSTVIDYGATPILAGDTIHVAFPNENVDLDFRIESVEYHVNTQEQTLEVTLELGKEPPQLADYLYGLRTFTVNVEKLSRTKLGKKGQVQNVGQSGGTSTSLIPGADNTYDVGSPARQYRNLYLQGKLVASNIACNLIPDTDGEWDIGDSTHRFASLSIYDFGSFGLIKIGNTQIISAGRVLQNVTADAAIIASGTFAIAQMPRDSAGLVLESQGAGFWPMYVNPNYRYLPASHGHVAADINGVFGESQVPNVYSGVIHFNGGITTNSVNCANWQLADAVFANNFRITESEKLGFSKGLAFLNDEDKVLMILTKSGDLQLAGKLNKLSTRRKKKRNF